MDTRQRTILLEHLPGESLEMIIAWLESHNVSLRITRRRNSKMGDYRPPLKGKHHRISVNGDLHPLAFLVTLVHEMAHLVTWEKYQRKVRPHGQEWKRQFRDMLAEVSATGIFSGEEGAILRKFIHGKISYRTFNMQFEKSIFKQDPVTADVMLSDIPINSRFHIHNGKEFIKLEKLRTRFRCQEVRTGRLYLVSGLAKVRLNEEGG